MAKIIAMEQEEDPWVVGGVSTSTWITKGSKNFVIKAWWTLPHC